MKFDAARAESIFHELGDPRYAGPGGEAAMADYAATRLGEVGLHVERRDLPGSRSQDFASRWLGFLGHAILVTGAYGLAVPESAFTAIASLGVLQLGFYWLGAGLEGRLRPRRRRVPLDSAPLVVASRRVEDPASVRVLFQAAPGGLRPDVFFPTRRAYGFLVFLGMGALLFVYGSLVVRLASSLLVGIGGALLPGGFHRWMGDTSRIIVRDALPTLLALYWVGIGGLVLWEIGQIRRGRLATPPDRRGLAVLLELARSWPRPGSRPIEPVFLVAGGHALDDPGSRGEVTRMLLPEGTRRPALLVVFVEPGAGEGIGLLTMDSRYAGLHEHARHAARDLWLPVRAASLLPTAPVLPFRVEHPAAIFIGSDSAKVARDAVDQQALHRAVQLATEIALRWARKQVPASPDTGG